MLTYDPICPDCGGAMRLRKNKQTDEKFWGCSFFPDCTGTRELFYPESLDAMEVADDLPSDRQRTADKKRWRE